MLAALLDGVDMVHALNHLAPDRILLVQPGRVVEAEEELAVGAVGIGRARRGNRAALVPFAGKFRLQVRQVRAAGTGAGRIAGLGHEAGDDAMEHDPVIEALACQFLDPLDVIGRQIGTKRDHDRSTLEFQDQGIFGITCHYFRSLHRLTSASATRGVVKGDTLPPSWAISLTRREAIAWWRGSAIRKTVSISALRRWFIATIWNSNSKSETARRPRMMTEAPTCSANLTSSVSNGRTWMTARPAASLA